MSAVAVRFRVAPGCTGTAATLTGPKAGQVLRSTTASLDLSSTEQQAQAQTQNTSCDNDKTEYEYRHFLVRIVHEHKRINSAANHILTPAENSRARVQDTVWSVGFCRRSALALCSYCLPWNRFDPLSPKGGRSPS